MSSFGEVLLKEVKTMLDGCAPGHRLKYRERNICVYYGALTYPNLPRGKGDNPPIQAGHVKNMVRHLGLDHDCVGRFLPQLKLK